MRQKMKPSSGGRSHRHWLCTFLRMNRNTRLNVSRFQCSSLDWATTRGSWDKSCETEQLSIEWPSSIWYALIKEDAPMPPRSIGSGAISFGLVSIPVKLYVAASSEAPSFNLLHAKCGTRIRQQRFCPTCNKVVERDDLVRGYEFAKDQYVRVTDDELKALEGEASEAIEDRKSTRL